MFENWLYSHVPEHLSFFFFFFNDTATTEIYTLSLHDALPIGRGAPAAAVSRRGGRFASLPPGSSASRSPDGRRRWPFGLPPGGPWPASSRAGCGGGPGRAARNTPTAGIRLPPEVVPR